MSLWTKAQQNYIHAIEEILQIKFEGVQSRENADIFIKKYRDQFTQAKLKMNKRFPPSQKQKKVIKEIEDILDVKFTGRTVRSASEFIKKYYDEHIQRQPFDMSRKIKTSATKIEERQRQRKIKK